MAKRAFLLVNLLFALHAGHAADSVLPPESIGIRGAHEIIDFNGVKYPKSLNVYADTSRMDASGESKKGTASHTYYSHEKCLHLCGSPETTGVFDIASLKLVKKKDSHADYSRCGVRFERWVELDGGITAPTQITLLAQVETPRYTYIPPGPKGELWCEYEVNLLQVRQPWNKEDLIK